MRGLRVGIVMAVVFLVGNPAAAAKKPQAASSSSKSAAGPVADDGWPDTREGALARRWVAAFVAGEDAMRSFYLKDLADKSRSEKSIEARLTRYRALRERMGKLVFGSVVKSVPGELTVKLLDADAAVHTFVFKARTSAPFQLLSVGMMETRPGGHGGGGGFHH